MRSPRPAARRTVRFGSWPTAGLSLVLSLTMASCSHADDTGDLEEESAEFRRARLRLVNEHLSAGRHRIKSKAVLEAMAEVPRHTFVPADQQDQAYRDSPLPIGYGQTISQPFVVGFMTEQLEPMPNEKVLEIGTGSGYQAAILSRLVKSVYSIEIVKPLAERATTVLEKLGYDNVHVRTGDGYLGWPEEAPFDAIIVTCAPEKIPRPLIDQLKEGGRMMIPVGPQGGRQDLYLLTKEGGEVKQTAVLPVRFVPMTGKAERD